MKVFTFLVCGAMAGLLRPDAFCLAQSRAEVPDFFAIVPNQGESLQEGISTARKRLSRSEREGEFWVGYRFEVREGLEFDRFYIHDEGWVTFSRNSPHNSLQEDDLEMSILRALGELGDEEAERRYQNRRHELLSSAIDQWGLFLLFDARTLEIQKVKLFHFQQRRLFEDRPGFWLETVSNDHSFDYLADLIRHDHHPADVIKPAILVLSLHEHGEVIPFLSDIAGGRDPFEIRKTAAFWLGQIPDEKSFDALTDLFERERSTNMKEKLVFSMSQHQSGRKIETLARIARNEDEHLEAREKAIFWLGQIEDEKSLDILEDLLDKSGLAELKEKAVFSISQHKSRRAPAILIRVAQEDGDREVRKKAIFWLGQLAGRKTLKALGEIVENEHETELRTKAVFAISQHKDKELAVDTLIEIAQYNPHPEVRKKAMFWLGQTGDARAVDFFKKVLSR